MSTWNMPPGVTTNDIPGNNSDEQLEAAYIKQCGEKMARTIAETWAEGLTLHESRNRERRREVIAGAIVTALEVNMSEIEIAETAAELVGNMTFADWVEYGGGDDE